MSNRPPIQLIGKFGEYFALKYLLEKGYEVRSFADLSLALGKQLIEDLELPLPDEEYRRRRIQSLSDRIPHFESEMGRVESSTEAYRHRRWLINRKLRLERMKKALFDLKAGRPLAEIDDPEMGRSSLIWRVYEEQDMQEKEARSFLGDKVDDFVKYCEECDEISRKHGIAGLSYRSDMVAKKESDYYVIEVKTNMSDLEGTQQEALKLAQRFGFKPRILRVAFEAHCTEIVV